MTFTREVTVAVSVYEPRFVITTLLASYTLSLIRPMTPYGTQPAYIARKTTTSPNTLSRLGREFSHNPTEETSISSVLATVALSLISKLTTSRSE